MAKGEADITQVHTDLLGGLFSDTLFDVGDTSTSNATDVPVTGALDLSSHTIPTPSIEREKLYKRFASQILTNTALDRSLVSNQANKKLPFYSWFRYREGFSEPFVDYVISHILNRPKPGILLDPFSGAGSALFAASVRGWQTKGIEILPVGIYATRARFIVEKLDVAEFHALVKEISQINFADYSHPDYELKHIRITNGAIPQIEEQQLTGYISYCQQHIADEDVRTVLLYAAMCILEEISYTRKDGQFLRWDARSGRSVGEKPFNKGRIYTFRSSFA